MDDDDFDYLPRRRVRIGCECVGENYPQGGCPGPSNCPIASHEEEEEEEEEKEEEEGESEDE